MRRDEHESVQYRSLKPPNPNKKMRVLDVLVLRGGGRRSLEILSERIVDTM